MIDAKFSSPFVVATAFVHGRVTLDDFTPERLRDPCVLALAAKASHAVETSFPTPASGMLMVRLNDGRYLERRIDTPLGDPSRPMSWDELCAKMRGCAARARTPLSARQADTLADLIGAIQAQDDAAGAIFSAIRGG
jgi:2-methylcitrate dehydratase PrpD